MNIVCEECGGTNSVPYKPGHYIDPNQKWILDPITLSIKAMECMKCKPQEIARRGGK
jgi:hypothetical protein